MPDTCRPPAEPSPSKPLETGWLELHLGTKVAIHCESDAGSDPRPAIARAFEEIADIHQLMSFHEPGSDLSRLNRGAARGPVRIDERTMEVIRFALEVSRLSSGYFDITIAPELVSNGSLPAPDGAPEPHAGASWQDIEIASDHSVYFHRPLWIDLAGIAKGYAVDRAFRICREAIGDCCTVNAGGDIRVGHGRIETITLDVSIHSEHLLPQVELTGGAIASSESGTNRATARTVSAQHFDGQTRQSLTQAHFVSVLAEQCVTADALSKVVLSMGRSAQSVLKAFNATALCHTPDAGWQQLPEQVDAIAPVR